jgi:hypothetical protein
MLVYWRGSKICWKDFCPVWSVKTCSKIAEEYWVSVEFIDEIIGTGLVS